MEVRILPTPVTEAAFAVLPLWDALEAQYNQDPNMTAEMFMAETHRLQLQAAEIDPANLKNETDFSAAYAKGNALIQAAREFANK